MYGRGDHHEAQTTEGQESAIAHLISFTILMNRWLGPNYPKWAVVRSFYRHQSLLVSALEGVTQEFPSSWS